MAGKLTLVEGSDQGLGFMLESYFKRIVLCDLYFLFVDLDT